MPDGGQNPSGGAGAKLLKFLCARQRILFIKTPGNNIINTASASLPALAPALASLPGRKVDIHADLCRMRETGLLDLLAEMSRQHWREYVTARVLEITCGEAPFLASRYDLENGLITPVRERVGMLDRKLAAIQAQNESDWIAWAYS